VHGGYFAEEQVVRILLLLGWTMEMPRFWWVILEALVIGVMSDSAVAVPMNAVNSIDVGLVQPVLWGVELAQLTATSIPDKSAGAHRQLHGVGQFSLALLPPMMS
jgi:hypothetical protein